VARRERRGHGVEGVRERAGDLALVQVLGHRLDVERHRLQALVVVGRDPEAQDVDRLRLASEPGRELLGDERVVVPVGELHRPRDRVVIGERHEVHAAALRQLVGLLGRRGTLGEAEGALDAEPRLLRGLGVDVEVGPAGAAAIVHGAPAFRAAISPFVR
jgi:hypothetical protein